MSLSGATPGYQKGDLVYAWTTNEDIARSAECGGAVTGLQKFALESGMVDAVLAVKRGSDIYDAIPVVITDPADLAQTAGSLHCGTLLLAKLIKKYLGGTKDRKIGVTVKGCDTMGLLELARRGEINLDNVVMIGVNCGGSVSPLTARKMIREKFEVDPDAVHKEEIDKGQFIIEYDGGHKGISMDDLEDEGYGRRSNCRRCLYKIPRQADLACGNWGVIGDKAGKATFIEVCSDKGARLLSDAVAAGAIATEPANPKGVEIRGKVEGAMEKLGQKWRNRDFTALKEDLWGTIERETSRCIKCYSCIEQCPVCFTDPDQFEKNSPMIRRGGLPVDGMFHLRRFAHISDSCINCGQCEELCPMEIPLALFSHAIRNEADLVFEPKLGRASYTN
ncbi:MAG: Coenzyme F420 hydrogenase/dehydrogenase, beta subunit C-terminal domain [Methanomicrobiaceae archaeon]|uniref:Formate dehydrogenase beta subunit n=1 Tax=hydrocarbon metagenome TaxID=938273 RepID=A0A0W8FF64_9ZZZZ|nr:Coenzyme F420 hydrogenase/dehydrogenase, beta subunit C-terminal domain [Methanomicrobiaceae archaeon]MDD5419707.1 Coenzyme F420 hydrogenase/dehydrogenase, beta subunit C-terminal domain [Methanomicrobiaceae archaeon]